MALPTAATFFIVAVGVLCARPRHGIMAVISSNTSGGTMVRRLLPAVVIVPVLLGGLHLVGERAKIFDTALGLWLLAVAIMTVFAVLVARNAQLLFRSDLDRAVADRTLEHQATHDSLTQLPNRRLFLQRLRAEFDRAHENGTFAAVLLVDLDLFKVVNDSLGHVVGDELLVAAARRVRDCIEGDELVARLSGDEFTVLIPSLSDRRAGDRARRTDPSGLRSPVSRRPARSLHLGQHRRRVQQLATRSATDLVRHADIAMYAAKARGKARHEIFEPVMDLAARQRLELENGLRQAHRAQGAACLLPARGRDRERAAGRDGGAGPLGASRARPRLRRPSSSPSPRRPA